MELLCEVKAPKSDQGRLLPNLYTLLIHTRAKLSEERDGLVNLGIPMECAPSCNSSQHERCKAAWVLFWHTTVIPKLFSDTPPSTETDWEEFLSKEPTLLSINEDCHADHIAKLQNLGIFEAERSIRDDGVSAAMTYDLCL